MISMRFLHLMARGAVIALVAYLVFYLLIVLVVRLMTREIALRDRRVRIRFRAWMPRLFGRDATTVFGVIWVADVRAPADLVAHEYCHVQQERSLFYVFYLPVYFWLMWRGHSYLNDRMEIDARAFSAAHREEFADIEAAV
jgi:hypothetical protein